MTVSSEDDIRSDRCPCCSRGCLASAKQENKLNNEVERSTSVDLETVSPRLGKNIYSVPCTSANLPDKYIELPSLISGGGLSESIENKYHSKKVIYSKNTNAMQQQHNGLELPRTPLKSKPSGRVPTDLKDVEESDATSSASDLNDTSVWESLDNINPDQNNVIKTIEGRCSTPKLAVNQVISQVTNI